MHFALLQITIWLLLIQCFATNFVSILVIVIKTF